MNILAGTYFQRIYASFLGSRFGLLDDLLLGPGGTSISWLENIVGQFETSN